MVKMKLQGRSYVLVICLTAGLGGFLFGFDTAVISGAINFLRRQFQLSAALEGWIMSSALVGCVAGAGIAGYLADRFGRKKVLLLSSLLFMLSAIGCAVAGSPATLVAARLTGGIGVGFAAMVAPMFIAELAPADIRGRLVSLYQLAITAGILLSYLTNAALLHYAGNPAHEGAFMHFYLVDEVWRAMLGSNMLPALLFFVLLLLVPESPRWLLLANRTAEAQTQLERINGPEEGRAELQAITRAISQKGVGFRQLWEPGLRKALTIGIVLPFLTQLTGITTVMYYAPAIFEKAGLGSDSAMGSAVLIGFFNMVFTIVGIWKIDRWGRKPLLVWGFAGLSIALFTIGILFSGKEEYTSLLLCAFVFYIAVFASTLGPGVWVVLSEIYPTGIRGRAMSLGTLSLFLGSTFVTQTYPVLRDSAGLAATFIGYGLLMVPAAFFVSKWVPETKGKTLEEIEGYWKQKNANA
jgi:sugar porter (SP) family MFS transporter